MEKEEVNARWQAAMAKYVAVRLHVYLCIRARQDGARSLFHFSFQHPPPLTTNLPPHHPLPRYFPQGNLRPDEQMVELEEVMHLDT